MPIRLKRYDFVEIVTVWGKKKMCIVIKGANLSFSGKDSKKSIILTDIFNEKGMKISYPRSYIVSAKKLEKKDLLFYLNLKNKHIHDAIFRMYSGVKNAELQF